MKKFLWIVSIAFILLFGGLKLLLTRFEPTKELELRLRAASLPDLTLTAVDGSTHTLYPGKPIILVYFNSSCDHCQRQVNSMKASRAAFEGISLILISSQESEDIIAFAATLGNPEGLLFFQCKPEEIAQKFGVLALPQIFVYDEKGALAGLFYGETSPQELLGALGR